MIDSLAEHVVPPVSTKTRGRLSVGRGWLPLDVLKNGIGVMVDDLLAAGYTLFVFALVVRLVGNA